MPEDLPPPPPPKDREPKSPQAYSNLRLSQELPSPPQHSHWRSLPASPVQHFRTTSTPKAFSSLSSSSSDHIQKLRRPSLQNDREYAKSIIEASRRHRMELFEDEKIAAQQAIQEEAERQARLRAEKDALMAEYAEQERIRKVQLQEDLRRAAIAKRRKAESELREEAESRRIIEQNRRAAKEKWLRESFERQEWRSRQDAIQKNLESSKAETRKRQQQARRSRTLHTQSRGEVFAGWVTVQKSTLPFLKRRYCRVRKLEMILTGTDEVSSPVLERIVLDSVVKVKEAEDGFEELEVLPHSFAVDLHDGESYTVLADSADEKEDLISVVIQLAGL